MMNGAELRTFLTIVETGSLIRASEVLHVTQSTVTTRLKSLEDALGQQLINRHKSGATLTAAGVRLQRYAVTITDLWQQARQETALPDGLSAMCNIACEADLWPGIGDRFFAYLQDNCPQVAISVWLGSPADVASWLSEGKSDIGFTHRPASGPRQSQIRLTDDQLILVSSHATSPVRFDPGYVFVEAGEQFARDHAAAYADAGTARLSFGSAQLGLLHLLKHGGSAYLPERIALPHLACGSLHALKEGPVFSRPIYLNVNDTARHVWNWFDTALAAVFPNTA